MTSPKQLAERALELSEKAVPGPWDQRCYNSLDNSATPRWVWSEYGWVSESFNPSATSNAELIAHAGTHYSRIASALIVAIEALEEIGGKHHIGETKFYYERVAREALSRINHEPSKGGEAG